MTATGRSSNESPSAEAKTNEDLKSHIRMGTTNRKKFNKMADASLKKQNVVLEKLKKDNETLKQTLDTMNRMNNLAQSKQITEKIEQLSVEKDLLERKIKVESAKREKLIREVDSFHTGLTLARSDRGPINIAHENLAVVAKQIAILENRLDRSLVKFNEALATNKQLRDSIENLRQEKEVFENIYKKMEQELHEKKKKMADIIEDSNAAYEERDEINHRLEALKVAAKEQMEKYDADNKELDEIHKKNEELSDQLKVQETERKQKGFMGEMTEDVEKPVKKRIIKTNWTIGRQKAKHQKNIDKMREYEEMFKKIESNTGLPIEELIKKFTQAEDSNFSLFTYVNELNSEIEKLEEQNAELEEEIKKSKGDDIKSDLQRKQQLADLQDQINLYNEKSDLYEQKHKSATKTMSTLSNGVDVIFKALGCDPKLVTEMLGTSDITESNIMVYLGMIEQKTSELVQAYANIKLNEDADSFAMGPSHPAGHTSITIQAPTTTEDEERDEDDVTDDEERPLTREELLLRSKKSHHIHRKKPKKNPKPKHV